MNPIFFLKHNCGFSCGDPDSEISKAWAEIEAMAQNAKRYELVRSAGEKMGPAIMSYNYGEVLLLLSGGDLDKFVDETLSGANT